MTDSQAHGWTSAHPFLERIVRVQVVNSDGIAQHGSGYLLANDLVITADHCVRGLNPDADTSSLRVTLAVNGQDVPVESVTSDRQTDIALIKLVHASELASEDVKLSSIDRSASGILHDCAGIGYPEFFRSPHTRSLRTAEFHGNVYATDGRDEGKLFVRELQIGFMVNSMDRGRIRTRRLGAPPESEWAGLSGAAVFYRNRLIGIVIEHEPHLASNIISARATDSFLLRGNPVGEMLLGEHRALIGEDLKPPLPQIRRIATSTREPSVAQAALPIHPLVKSEAQRYRPVFLQYLNPEIRACYGRAYNTRWRERDLAEALQLTKICLLCTEHSLIFPASYLFEVPIMQPYLSRLAPLREMGLIQYSSHVPDMRDYIEHKAGEYRTDFRNPYSKRQGARIGGLTYRPLVGPSAADDIGEEWIDSIEEGALSATKRSLWSRWPTGLGDPSDILVSIPNRLEGRAFIARFVNEALPVSLAPTEAAEIAMFLSRSYLRSYLLRLDAAIVGRLPIGDFTCGLESDPGAAPRIVSWRMVVGALQYLGLREWLLDHASWVELAELSEVPELGVLVSLATDVDSEGMIRRAAVRARRRFQVTNSIGLPAAIERLSVLAEELLVDRLYRREGTDDDDL